jgi:hypothetical protein
MPIDPKKFKKIVSNHFDNLSKEEFLETLHKSSPYLFDGSSEAKHDVPPSDRDEMTSQNIFSHILDFKSRWDRIDAKNYKEFTFCLEDEADRMKSNNINLINIKIYIAKGKLSYRLNAFIQMVKLLTDMITQIIAKKA